jgi:hypothetical protein
MKKKFLISLGLVSLMLFSMAFGAFAAAKITLIVNGKTANADVKIIDGSSYVPLRAVSQLLGADVNWDGTTKTITIKGKAEQTNSTPSNVVSYPVNVEIASGPMTMKISKVSLNPAYKKDQYSDPINAVVLAVEVENTSSDTIHWYPAQATMVLNTKEQAEGGMSLYHSDQVDGEFVGKVVKKGNIVFEVNSDLKEISNFNLKIDGAFGDGFERVGEDTTTEVILK